MQPARPPRSEPTPTTASPLDRPLAAHPRLLATPGRIERLRALTGADDYVARGRRALAAAADAAAAKPWAHAPGLAGSERLGGIVWSCALAWRLDGEERWFAAARDAALAAVRGPAWDRDEFLAIGEYAYALAFAYDWLHPRLAPAERAELAAGIRDRVLAAANAAYDEGDWWTDAAINWSHECNGGVIVAALAVAEDHPEAARAAIGPALRGMEHALDQYDPDGGWEEGPGYWGRATYFALYALDALATALGDDLGLSERRGLAGTGAFMIAATGPTGLLAAYADCGERRAFGNGSALWWLARRYGQADYARYVHERSQRAPSAIDLLWYEPPPAAAPALPLDRHFHGPADFASLRSGWDGDALYVWTKGGRNQVNHGHLDLGSFELDALGQRWVRDLGAEDYGLPGVWERRPGGKRWSYFRLNSHSHSVPLIDDADQHAHATARITATGLGGDDPFAIVDFTEAYHPIANPARRGYRLVGRRALLVQDEWHLRQPCRWTWGVTTDAAIALDGARATLELGGRTMIATIVEAPPGASFTVASAERPPPERPNTGVRRLLIDLSKVEGRIRVAVLLAPVWPGGAASAPRLEPLGRWL